MAAEYTRRLGVELVRTLRLPRNRGKGGAVRMGVLAARGERVLFADSDGATLIDDLERLEEAMKDLAGAGKADGAGVGGEPMKPAFVLGSRAHLEVRLGFAGGVLVYAASTSEKRCMCIVLVRIPTAPLTLAPLLRL